MKSRHGALGVCLALAGMFGALLPTTGCGDDVVYRVQPFFRVVDGTPVIDDELPTVDWQVPDVAPEDFINNAPLQIDVFVQETVRKVDILWLVDNSPKMYDAQASLAEHFDMFISDLARADPPVDYQLGVVTTDAVTEGGRMRELVGHPGSRFIACNAPDVDDECNVGSAAEAENVFRDTVQVGVDGTPIERGLLSVQLALSEPMRSGVNAGFLRDDAALYIIAISEEDDSSCHPFFVDPGTEELLPSGAYDYQACNFHPGCSCLEGDAQRFGSVEYFVRFFYGLKGYGNEDMVTFASIVAGDEGPIVLCLDEYCDRMGQFRGCRNEALGIEPIFAPRYIEVAARTGGAHISLCEENYSEVLADLGFAASGQRRSFALSRQPANPNQSPIGVALESPDGEGGLIIEDVPHVSEAGEGGWEYIRCESGEFVNSIRFHEPWVPAAGARVQVTYMVDVGGTTAC